MSLSLPRILPMTKSEILSGICGFSTVVEASMDGSQCILTITSECESIQDLSEALTRVDPFQEISYRDTVPLTYRLASKYCPHAACPVPVGVIKAVEVEAGLTLPADVSIKLSKPV